jgi:hypothetical protein
MHRRNQGSLMTVFVSGWFALLACASDGSAPDPGSDLERSIKCSGTYYWGEAVGDSLEQTRAVAKKEVVLSISQTVRVSESVQASPHDGTAPEAFRASTRSFSQVRIQGIGYLDSRRNGKYRILAYIPKEEFRRSLDRIAVEVKERMRIARTHLREKDTSGAMFSYYCAYLTTVMSPFPVRYESREDNAAFDDIRPFLFEKVATFLSRMEISAGSPRIDHTFDLIAIPVQVRFGGKPVGGISVCLDNPEGSARTMENGSADLFLYAAPSVRTRGYTIWCAFAFDERNSPPELVDIHSNTGIHAKRRIEVDFSDIIGIDFSVEKGKNSCWVFTPRLKHLSVSSVEWNFGDGRISTDFSPCHVFGNPGTYTVSLTINDSPDLTRSRRIHEGAEGAGTEKPFDTLEQRSGRAGIPPDVPPVIGALAAAENFNQFVGLLDKFKSKNTLVHGSKAAFFDPSQCYVFIFDRDTKTLLAVMGKGADTRTDLLSGKRAGDFEIMYKNQLLLWVEVY